MGKWVISREKQRNGDVKVTVKRWNNGKSERLPASRYKHLVNTPEELNRYLTRLDHEAGHGKKAIEIRHAFIDQKMLDEYFEFLKAQIPTYERAQAEFYYLKAHFLQFFTRIHPNPLEWHRIHKVTWTNYLSSSETPQSTYTKKEIVRAANRFMAWLHDQRPHEVPPLIFKPLSRAKIRDLEAQRILKGDVREKYYISAQDWSTIVAKAPEDIKSAILLGYKYGLRRSEILGLHLEDVYSLNLQLKRQLIKLHTFGPLKGREARSIPHWDSVPEECYKLVESIVMMSPDTFTEIFSEFTKQLKKKNEIKHEYHLHDLRHTWITRMVRLHAIRDVQLAAGHKDIRTTMGYLHDDRAEDKPFKPTG